MILVDTSGLLAYYDRSERFHDDALAVMARTEPRILSPFVLAELDYTVSRYGDQAGELAILADVARGVFELPTFGPSDVAAALAVIRQYADLHLGLTDASIVVLAERYGCADVLTLDQRHFRALVGPRGAPFHLLPFDV